MLSYGYIKRPLSGPPCAYLFFLPAACVSALALTFLIWAGVKLFGSRKPFDAMVATFGDVFSFFGFVAMILSFLHGTDGLTVLPISSNILVPVSNQSFLAYQPAMVSSKTFPCVGCLFSVVLFRHSQADS